MCETSEGSVDSTQYPESLATPALDIRPSFGPAVCLESVTSVSSPPSER